MHPLAARTQLLLFPAPHPTIPNHRACLLATPVPPSTLLRLLRTTATPPAGARSPPRAVSPTTTTVATDDGSTQSDSGANTSGSKWAEFAARVSGEWDGYGADFTVSGDPLELPANVVPEAFREWGVEVFDWQTQCPTLADPATPCALHYRLVRLLPTVGCEADAATVYTSHQRHASSASAFAYGGSSSSSYVAAWPKGPATVLEIEHCVVHPEIGDDEVVRRARIVQTVALASKAPGAVLRGVKVFSEQWYGPFRNGDQLGGCALREAAFAAGERLAKSEVVGSWESSQASAAKFSGTGKFAGLEPDEPRRTARDEAGLGVLTLLPKQLWSSFKVDEEAGEVVCEVGWVLGQGRALTSRCILSKDGDVKEIAAACESRVSEGT
ncbi:uncharacterized protein LOC100833038 [Brachypodium distachyon]|uniref:DUF3598 domain-containing protein n=1 Tax=Brachypodium distachyon TaxID=15368 RepID=I1HA69_BRADI|nr:uncharacterized protein LOC100833038 [Brachypodium distachyon]KQK23858.1 hypothetical protein BRADI_1g76550v3 [Brachypodium distachyon]|eukprot:XP_010229265.1 uncharacterized protein LOC100833038 [Brachypodium distachyon]